MHFVGLYRTQKGYPLIIEPTKVEYIETPLNYEFVQSAVKKLDYTVFYRAAQQIASLCQPPLPTLPESLGGVMGSDDGVQIKETIQIIHSVLLDYHVVEGFLVCPDTKRKFTILQGIPNMILHEDEL